jgi:hypothetical protein
MIGSKEGGGTVGIMVGGKEGGGSSEEVETGRSPVSDTVEAQVRQMVRKRGGAESAEGKWKGERLEEARVQAKRQIKEAR